MDLVIGMLGYGTVGSGFIEVAQNSHIQRILKERGVNLQIKSALVRNPGQSRPFPISVTTQSSDIVEDPEINVVVEVMGGVEPAKDYVSKALSAGKSVVTSNKALVASHPELTRLAKDKGTHLLFEASVGGGVPIIRTLSHRPFGIRSLDAVVNGTTNFILGQMENDVSFSDALSEAKRLHLTEPDPNDDINGTDAAYKLSILVLVGFGVYIPPSKISRQGIEDITLRDVQKGLNLGYRYKLVARAKHDEQIKLEVKPELVSCESFLGSISGAQNGFIVSDGLHEFFLSGEGAGALPTGCSIMDDIIWLINNLATGR